MSKAPSFDIQDAHKYFSAHCFNKTWSYIENSTRTPQENDEMLHTCLASLWHWSQRADATPKNFSIGYWQLSRVYALLGNADEARKYAELSLDNSSDLEPFFKGYAYEALARSEMVAGNRDKMNNHLSAARGLCDAVKDADSKKLLAEDLNSIK